MAMLTSMSKAPMTDSGPEKDVVMVGAGVNIGGSCGRDRHFLGITGSSKINGAKLSDACSVRANWLCMGWPFCLAEMRREFQTGGKLFCTTLYTLHQTVPHKSPSLHKLAKICLILASSLGYRRKVNAVYTEARMLRIIRIERKKEETFHGVEAAMEEK